MPPTQKPSKNSDTIPRSITATKAISRTGKQRKKAAILPNKSRATKARRQIAITEYIQAFASPTSSPIDATSKVTLDRGIPRPETFGPFHALEKDRLMSYQRRNMKTLKPCLSMLAVVLAGALVGCSTTSTKSPDVSDGIRKSLDQANLKDVSVSQDRDKGVVTLGGHVAAEADKSQAESIAKSIASGQVVSNQIAVLPPSAESEAKAVNSDLDKGVEKNLDAALIQHRLHKSVKYDAKNGVVTLTGEVKSQSQRAEAERVASSVPNVKQVVNELQVKNQKARSSK
jgi:hyperosmotically inducible protein